MDPELITRCRERLITVSRQRVMITYGDMAAYLGVARQSVGRYLNAIYNDLVINNNLPDLTLLVVYNNTMYGNYNSRDLPAQSIEFDQNNPAHCRLSDSDREQVYLHWS
jgi:hypothetical protein